MANIQMGGAFDPTRDVGLAGTLSVTGVANYLLTTADLIATGATGTTAAAVPALTPALITCNATGVSGAGIVLPVPVAGQLYDVINQMTGVLKIYAPGATINGTTGTTAFSLTATGNKKVQAICTVAGAWALAGNT